MLTRQLGDRGPEVSEVGLGTNNFGTRMEDSQVGPLVARAIELGVNFFDTADVYGGGASERLLGAALAGRRSEVLIATKFGKPRSGDDPNLRRGAPGYIRDAVDQSLTRLGTDYIDLLQMHEPDPETPIEETLGALAELVKEGKVRWIGCSNFEAWRVVDSQWVARSQGLPQWVSSQDHYNLLYRNPERELIPALRRMRIGLLPFYPLASGLLTGKYLRGQAPPPGSRLARPRMSDALDDPRNWEIVERLRGFAEDRDLTLLQVSIGALLGQPTVACVIAGATRLEQLSANVEASMWRPSQEDWAELDRITEA